MRNADTGAFRAIGTSVRVSNTFFFDDGAMNDPRYSFNSLPRDHGQPDGVRPERGVCLGSDDGSFDQLARRHRDVISNRHSERQSLANHHDTTCARGVAYHGGPYRHASIPIPERGHDRRRQRCESHDDDVHPNAHYHG
jgi:hypothetical protein